MYFKQTQSQPQLFAMQDISREDAEMLIQAIIALKEAKYMDHEEFADERRKLEELYKKMNHELIRSHLARVNGPNSVPKQKLLPQKSQTL